MNNAHNVILLANLQGEKSFANQMWRADIQSDKVEKLNVNKYVFWAKKTKFSILFDFFNENF